MVVMPTALAETVGAVGVVQPWSGKVRQTAAWGLPAYALCVWRTNVQHMLVDLANPGHALGLIYHVPHLAVQRVLIWWPLWAANVIG